jgi:hypothetical protein
MTLLSILIEQEMADPLAGPDHALSIISANSMQNDRRNLVALKFFPQLPGAFVSDFSPPNVVTTVNQCATSRV